MTRPRLTFYIMLTQERGVNAMTIAEKIEHALAELLLAGDPPPCPLRLEAVASHYQVSTRPVRTAVEALLKRGLLVRRSGRQLEPVKPPERRRRPRQDERPLAMADPDPYTAIAHDLIGRSLTGDDAFVRERSIAERFEFSTTVVREVFNRLVGEGFLEHVPRRGWRLRPLHQKDMDDFTNVRQVLEIEALRLGWDRIDRERMRDLMERNALPGGGRTIAEPDNRLHREIIDAADNRYIKDFFARHGRYFELLFVWEGRDPAAALDAVRQHRQILGAILRGDRRSAEKALRDHLRCQHPGLDLLVAAESRRAGNRASAAG